jgi:anti-sigma B factor antagonist
MKFKVTKNGKTTILKAEFLILCKPAVTEKLVVDLETVEFCDSSGLSALLIADRTMREHGGSVILVHVHRKVIDLMTISQLDRVFTIQKKLADALKA